MITNGRHIIIPAALLPTHVIKHTDKKVVLFFWTKIKCFVSDVSPLLKILHIYDPKKTNFPLFITETLWNRWRQTNLFWKSQPIVRTPFFPPSRNVSVLSPISLLIDCDSHLKGSYTGSSAFNIYALHHVPFMFFWFCFIVWVGFLFLKVNYSIE